MNHELFQSSTFFELLVGYFQDYYEANPLESYRNDDGSIQFKNTGDSLIDKWEQELQDGNIPDLLEAFSETQKENLIKRLEKAKGQNPLHRMFGNT